jgi:hypothetical protein
VPGGGWINPDPDVLMHFRNDQHAAWLASGNTAFPDPMTELTCELTQLTPNQDCSVKQTTATSDGWCYVENPPSGCPQEILFTPNARPKGVDTSLQCLEQQPDVLGDGGH